jgi:hypothetical protein
MTTLKDTPLRPSKAPNLPIAPVEYNQQYVDQLSNALRLYFSQLDNDWAGLLSNLGGAYLTFPHIAASDTTNQYALGNNTPTKVAWNTLDSGNGFTLNVDGTATALKSGVYKIDYSLQFVNTSNLEHDILVWLQITDGTTYNVPGSASKFTIRQRKSAGVPSYLVAYSSVTFQITAGEKIALWWATDLAYVASPLTDGVYMEAIPAITSPYSAPAAPSAVGSIVFVSAPA